MCGRIDDGSVVTVDVLTGGQVGGDGARRERFGRARVGDILCHSPILR